MKRADRWTAHVLYSVGHMGFLTSWSRGVKNTVPSSMLFSLFFSSIFWNCSVCNCLSLFWHCPRHSGYSRGQDKRALLAQSLRLWERCTNETVNKGREKAVADGTVAFASPACSARATLVTAASPAPPLSFVLLLSFLLITFLMGPGHFCCIWGFSDFQENLVVLLKLLVFGPRSILPSCNTVRCVVSAGLFSRSVVWPLQASPVKRDHLFLCTW